MLALPVKFGGLGIPNPVVEGERHHDTSVSATAHLAAALVPEGQPFSLQEHKGVAMAARMQARQDHQEELTQRLDGILADRPALDKRRVGRSRECGAWLTVLPLLWAGTGLKSEEYRDAIRLRYGLTPEGMVERCEGCGKPFTVEHALSCKVGGQVLARHNDLK